MYIIMHQQNINPFSDTHLRVSLHIVVSLGV